MPDEHGKLTPGELKERWNNQKGRKFREEILRQLQSEENEYSVDWEKLRVPVEGVEYAWETFEGVREIQESVTRKYRGNFLLGDLRGVDFFEKDLKKAFLSGAHLEGASLEFTHLEGAKLYRAHFEGANFEEAYLEDATLFDTDLENANFSGAHLNNTNLAKANLQGANFSSANLDGAQLLESKIRLKSWWLRIKECFWKSKNKNSKWKTASKRPTLLTGAVLKNVRLDADPILYRELLDEQYLDSFAEKHKFLYPFWLLTSNCGRWTFLVFIWAFLIAVVFGIIYSQSSFIYFGYGTVYEWWHPYYLSFVTMTTLGMASVEPVTTWAAIAHTIENFFGYALLGYAIAVFGSKFTRRSA